MKWYLPIAIAVLTLLAKGYVTAQPNPTPPCRARTPDLRAIARKGQILPQSVQTPLEDSSTCYKELQNAELYIAPGTYNIAVDSLEAFVDSCYTQPYSFQAFGYLNGAVSGVDSQQAGLDFRNWLFKVLYLNTDTMYYCLDVNDLYSTFNYAAGPRGYDVKGWIAVEKYIVESGKCPYSDSLYKLQLAQQWSEIHGVWLDTVKDSLLTPFDSTLPTLQQIGFQALLGPQYAASHNGVIPSSVLGEIGISPNPFVDNTVVYYTLNVPATLTVDVYDLLGHHITSPIPSVFTNNGEFSFTLPGSTIVAGTYYIRFSVPEGEVKSIQVVKE